MERTSLTFTLVSAVTRAPGLLRRLPARAMVRLDVVVGRRLSQDAEQDASS